MIYQILYRGSLSSCNYACGYCPFAKTTNTTAELRQDEKQLDRFVDWIETQATHPFGLLFTPWGEALIHPYYQRAMTRLSHLPHVQRVAIQTNLSGRLDWIPNSNKRTLALWATYHPSQGPLDEFLGQCQLLDGEGVRYSVGIVGLRENFAAMEELRSRLSPKVYLWVNAYKDIPGYYSVEDVARITQVDPLFGLNNQFHASAGQPCRAGETSFSIDGDGNVYRCHFIKSRLGNLYQDEFPQFLQPRVCTKSSCGCYIGYIHLKPLELETKYGEGLLERIPISYSIDPSVPAERLQSVS
jgi:hypothetical protein